MSAYLSPVSACYVHRSGFARIGSVEITRMPLVETAEGSASRFTRLGAALAAEALLKLGLRLPTVVEYAALKAVATHIEPAVLPTPAMLAAAGVRASDQAAIQRVREVNMMTLEWCDIHDSKVWALLAEWAGSTPVDNAGKHWAHPDVYTPPRHSLIVGWWTPRARSFGVANDTMIQQPSSFHDDAYVDYATTFHGVREVAP